MNIKMFVQTSYHIRAAVEDDKFTTKCTAPKGIAQWLNDLQKITVNVGTSKAGQHNGSHHRQVNTDRRLAPLPGVRE